MWSCVYHCKCVSIRYIYVRCRSWTNAMTSRVAVHYRSTSLLRMFIVCNTATLTIVPFVILHKLYFTLHNVVFVKIFASFGRIFIFFKLFNITSKLWNYNLSAFETLYRLLSLKLLCYIRHDGVVTLVLRSVTL